MERKKRKISPWRKLLLGMSLLLLGLLMVPAKVRAGGIYNNPNVTFSPDRKAFTTNAGDRRGDQYANGTVVSHGGSSARRALKAGEHYYAYYRDKNVPIGYWKVEHQRAYCIHNAYPPIGVSFHQIPFGRQACHRSYYSGWRAYCADCEGSLLPMLVYMSREAAVSISRIDLDLAYYYLCPHCGNLEQGVELSPHRCTGISYNQYRIRYDKNGADVLGIMGDSVHMYDNAQSYEGNRIAPEIRLRSNSYVREGYRFLGWNTRPDGSGQGFADGQEIWNLTQENYDGRGRGLVVLYAQWSPITGILRIDPAGGAYQGDKGIFEIEQKYNTFYEVRNDGLEAPEGNTVTFRTQGGSETPPLKNTFVFREWLKSQPFHGKFQGNVYYFTGNHKDVDTLKAVYEASDIILPQTSRPGYRFQGWYYDPECRSPAGNALDPFVPAKDVTLYAGWEEVLNLSATLERILEPHDPVFRCGESGVLKFTVWGYADRVEVSFPKELTEKYPEYDVTYQYDGKLLTAQESLQFMVPLYTPMGEYSVWVRAYRGDKMAEELLKFWTLGEEESVLSEIRTRLR